MTGSVAALDPSRAGSARADSGGLRRGSKPAGGPPQVAVEITEIGPPEQFGPDRWGTLPIMSIVDDFYALSPDSVLEAVEGAGLPTTGHCFALNALENRVYDVRLEDERHVVVKFYRPERWSAAAIGEEHAMLHALEAAEIPVCVPLRFDDGSTLRSLRGIHFAIWPRTGGRSPDEFSDDELALLGRLLARIHDTADGLKLEHRPVLDPESVPLRALEALDAGGFLPPSVDARYHTLVESIVAIYRERANGVPLQPIHGDCHAGNLLRDRDRWFFLDFDDMVVGPAVQDVWMLLPGRDSEAARQRAHLVDAYRAFRPFDDRWFDLIEPLRAFRYVFYAGWIARRWDDPCFPDAFPHFGTEDYWVRETQDLEDQLHVIEGGRLPMPDDDESTPSEGEERELTNADFFWDL